MDALGLNLPDSATLAQFEEWADRCLTEIAARGGPWPVPISTFEAQSILSDALEDAFDDSDIEGAKASLGTSTLQSRELIFGSDSLTYQERLGPLWTEGRLLALDLLTYAFGCNGDLNHCALSDLAARRWVIRVRYIALRGWYEHSVARLGEAGDGEFIAGSAVASASVAWAREQLDKLSGPARRALVGAAWALLLGGPFGDTALQSDIDILAALAPDFHSLNEAQGHRILIEIVTADGLTENAIQEVRRLGGRLAVALAQEAASVDRAREGAEAATSRVDLDPTEKRFLAELKDALAREAKGHRSHAYERAPAEWGRNHRVKVGRIRSWLEQNEPGLGILDAYMRRGQPDVRSLQDDLGSGITVAGHYKLSVISPASVAETVVNGQRKG